MADNNSKKQNDENLNENIHKISSINLLKSMRRQGKYLLQKEVELAKTELLADVRSEANLAGGFSVGIAAAYATGILLLVTGMLALSLVVPGWVAGLIVSGITLIISIVAFLFGYFKRVQEPLVRTREVLKADTQIAKGQQRPHAA
jgi:membrane-bound ClpP family serine protease